MSHLAAHPGAATTVTTGNAVVYTNSSAAGMVNYGGYPGYPPAQPAPGYGAPMPPSYAPGMIRRIRTAVYVDMA